MLYGFSTILRLQHFTLQQALNEHWQQHAIHMINDIIKNTNNGINKGNRLSAYSSLVMSSLIRSSNDLPDGLVLFKLS